MHPCSAPALHIPLRFESAYAAVAPTGQEPLWSNWHSHSFKETLDYLFVATHRRPVTAEPSPEEGDRRAAEHLLSIAAAAAASSSTPSKGKGKASEEDGSSLLMPHLVAVVPPAAASASPAGGAAGSGSAAGKDKEAKPPITGLPIGSRIVAGPWVPMGTGPRGTLQAVSVLGIPSDEEVTRFAGGREGGCPNAGHGSDHIPLAAYFEWR